MNAKLISIVFGTEGFFNAKCLRQPGKQWSTPTKGTEHVGQLNARILENNSVVS